MKLPREEMAFRKEYEALVTQRKLTTVFRPGNRIYPNFRGYKRAEIITARVIEKPGSDQHEIAPVFNDIRMSIQITEIHTVDIQKLIPLHFEGSSPDIQDVHALISHLEYIYGVAMKTYGHEVTRICIKYLDISPNPSQMAGRG